MSIGKSRIVATMVSFATLGWGSAETPLMRIFRSVDVVLVGSVDAALNELTYLACSSGMRTRARARDVLAQYLASI